MRKVIFLLIIFLSLSSPLWAADPFIGTWKLNVAKSKADYPDAIPESEILEISSQQNGIKTALDGVSAGGNAYHIESIGKWNGEDAQAKGHPAILTFAINKISTHTAEFIIKKKDGYLESWHATLSEDGNTMTSAGKGKLNGQEYSGSFVYEKQFALGKEDIEADIKNIRNIIKERNNATRAGDVNRFIALYTDEAIKILPSDPALIGKEAIRDWAQSIFSQISIPEIIEIKDINVSGDLAVAYMTWSADVTPKTGGDSSKDGGKWIGVFKRQVDGTWKIIYGAHSLEF